MLAEAIGGVAQHYDFLGKVNAEAVAWSNLVAVCGMVYGPRIFALKARRAKPVQEDNGSGIVIPGTFSGGGFRQ